MSGNDKREVVRQGVALIVGCADDYLAAVAALTRIHEGKSLVELSPSKVPEAYAAWLAVNNAGRRLRECVDALRPLASDPQP